jgi:hypothetical protein
LGCPGLRVDEEADARQGDDGDEEGVLEGLSSEGKKRMDG